MFPILEFRKGRPEDKELKGQYGVCETLPQNKQMGVLRTGKNSVLQYFFIEVHCMQDPGLDSKMREENWERKRVDKDHKKHYIKNKTYICMVAPSRS